MARSVRSRLLAALAAAFAAAGLCGCPATPKSPSSLAWDEARQSLAAPDTARSVEKLLDTWESLPQLELRGDVGLLQAAVFRHLARLHGAPGSPLTAVAARDPRLAGILKDCPTAADLRFRAAMGARKAMLFPGGAVTVDPELSLARDLALADYLADRLHGDGAVFIRGPETVPVGIRDRWGRLAAAEFVADHYARAWDRAAGDAPLEAARSAFLGFLGTLKLMWEECARDPNLRLGAREAAEKRQQSLTGVQIAANGARKLQDTGYEIHTELLQVDPGDHLDRGGEQVGAYHEEMRARREARAREFLLLALGHYVSAAILYDLQTGPDATEAAADPAGDPRARDPRWNTAPTYLQTIWTGLYKLNYQESAATQ